MADETVRPRRTPVKPEILGDALNAPQRRPTLDFVEQALGGPLDTRQRAAYLDGVFDDCPKKGPRSAAEIVEIDGLNVWYSERSKKMTAEFAAAAQRRAEEQAATRRNPQDYLCVDCHREFDYLKTISLKLCRVCNEARLDVAEAEWLQQEAERKQQTAVAVIPPRKTTAEARADLERARRRVKRTSNLQLAIERLERQRVLIARSTTDVAMEKKQRLDHYIASLNKQATQWRLDNSAAAHVYFDAMEADHAERNARPPRWCHWDGEMLPWDAEYCDGKCRKEVEARGTVYADMGEQCVCGARLTAAGATPENLAALPRVDGQICHTYECLSSQIIDMADYQEFGPDAACWKPITHTPAVKPAWTLAARQHLALPLMGNLPMLGDGSVALPIVIERRQRIIAYMEQQEPGTWVAGSVSRTWPNMGDTTKQKELWQGLAREGVLEEKWGKYRLLNNPNKQSIKQVGSRIV